MLLHQNLLRQFQDFTIVRRPLPQLAQPLQLSFHDVFNFLQEVFKVILRHFLRQVHGVEWGGPFFNLPSTIKKAYSEFWSKPSVQAPNWDTQKKTLHSPQPPFIKRGRGGIFRGKAGVAGAETAMRKWV